MYLDDDKRLHYLSSFFESEKKLGSYLVRLLPLLLSIIYFNNYKISTKLELIILAFWNNNFFII